MKRARRDRFPLSETVSVVRVVCGVRRPLAMPMTPFVLNSLEPAIDPGEQPPSQRSARQRGERESLDRSPYPQLQPLAEP